MPIKIFRTNIGNFPEKTNVCGAGILDKSLLLCARRLRTEWVYGKLRRGIVINTAVDCGEAIGQITALPLSESPIELDGDGLYYIPCIWMVPELASPKLGEELLSSVVEDIGKTAKGSVTITDERWMSHRSFLERFGFTKIGELERVGNPGDIMFLPFIDNGDYPQQIMKTNPRGETPRLDFFSSPHCPAHAITEYRLTKEHASLPFKIHLSKHNSGERKTILRWGHSFALIFNGEKDILRDFLRGTSLEQLIKENI